MKFPRTMNVVKPQYELRVGNYVGQLPQSQCQQSLTRMSFILEGSAAKTHTPNSWPSRGVAGSNEKGACCARCRSCSIYGYRGVADCFTVQIYTQLVRLRVYVYSKYIHLCTSFTVQTLTVHTHVNKRHIPHSTGGTYISSYVCNINPYKYVPRLSMVIASQYIYSTVQPASTPPIDIVLSKSSAAVLVTIQSSLRLDRLTLWLMRWVGLLSVVFVVSCMYIKCNGACYQCVVFMFLGTPCVLHFMPHQVVPLCSLCTFSSLRFEGQQNVHVWYSNIIFSTAIPPKTRSMQSLHTRADLCLPIPPLHQLRMAINHGHVQMHVSISKMHHKHTLCFMQLSARLSLFLNTDSVMSHATYQTLSHPAKQTTCCKLKHMWNAMTSHGGNCGTILCILGKEQSGLLHHPDCAHRGHNRQGPASRTKKRQVKQAFHCFDASMYLNCALF